MSDPDQDLPPEDEFPLLEDAETAPEPGEDEARGERIAKFLARAGVASRRDAEKLLDQRVVRLNGELITHPATFIKPGDEITVRGVKVAEPQRTRLWRYHKPEGLVTEQSLRPARRLAAAGCATPRAARPCLKNSRPSCRG